MAKVKVRVGIYKATRFNSDYCEGEIVTEEQYEEVVADTAERLKNSTYEFEEYLCDNYTYGELWEMDEDDKVKVRKHYEEKCVEWARDDLDSEWEYEEIETAVEVPCGCPCPKRK